MFDLLPYPHDVFWKGLRILTEKLGKIAIFQIKYQRYSACVLHFYVTQNNNIFVIEHSEKSNFAKSGRRDSVHLSFNLHLLQCNFCIGQCINCFIYFSIRTLTDVVPGVLRASGRGVRSENSISRLIVHNLISI